MVKGETQMKCPMCLGKGYATDEDIKEYPHRCQNCNGKGFYSVDWQKVRCEVCNGSGEKPMTNEEWIKQANTEQLAEAITDIVYECKDWDDCMDCRLGWCSKDYVVEWLKQPHKDTK